MTLTFETPSKKCPLRKFNGRPCTIDFECGRAMLRRTRQRTMLYGVSIDIGYDREPIRGFAFADEIHIEPETNQQRSLRELTQLSQEFEGGYR